MRLNQYMAVAFVFFITTNALLSQNFIDLSAQSGLSVAGMNHGVAIGDFNGDELEDIYVSVKQGKNLLYVNKGGFSFEESSAIYGLDYQGDTNMSLWFDMDNDGDLDLILGNKFENNVLYRNEGTHFDNVSYLLGPGTAGNLRSINAVDYDNDGDLDLYIAYLGKQNILYRNDGVEGYRDVTLVSGINDMGSSMAAVFFDMDNDGDQDLYQCHDGNQANHLYLNNGDGTFANISLGSNADYQGFGMGTEVADFNQDGYLDIYLSNLYENVLFVNNHNNTFTQISNNSPVNDIGMGWGTFAFDCDNDGQMDLYVANESNFPVNGMSNIPNKLFRNIGNLNFIEIENGDGILSTGPSYGTAYGDFDNDGRLDIIVANEGQEGNQIFKNNSAQKNYLALKLRGVDSNSHGIGAVVEIFGDNHYQKDILTAGSGYASQNTSKIYFGLGDIDEISKIIIHWPSGNIQTIEYPQMNTLLTIDEVAGFVPQGALVWSEPAFPSQLDDITLYYDAKEGNGALANFSGTVYAHTGVITNASTSPSDWKHVQGTWGTADPNTQMTSEGNGVYSLSYNITDYYGINNGEEVLQLAFVFRDATGSTVGRDTDGSDIYLDIYPPNEGLLATLYSPGTSGNIIYLGDSIEVSLQVNKSADIEVLDNGSVVHQSTGESASFYITPTVLGLHELQVNIQDNEGNVQALEATYFVLNANPVLEDAPDGTSNGLNYVGDQSYIFQLYAPAKEHVFLLCPSNDYQVDFNFQLNKSTDNATFWIELPKSLFADGKNTYQYLVDGAITIADPYSRVVLDPWNDGSVPQDVMSTLPDYPDSAEGIVTAFDIDKPQYAWNDEQYEAPAQDQLIIYELLMRDFLADHSYKSLLDTLDYLQRLGINAIELMPINEFEGNQSWGYNPSFHMAIDKYYGSRDQLKAVIDECHTRGIAVILDVVFNHVFSQSPLAQLYWDSANFRPASDNPWLNVTATHPFNVGYDVNHESTATKDWVKQVLSEMMNEYHFDGFRFDLSKGFTQKISGDNSDLMAQYDQSRINILKDYADHVWSVKSGTYVVLEHFAYNDEEIALSNYGMMLWGNMTHDFGQAAKGKTSNLEWLDYKVRGWNAPRVVGYMESHDEERLMYKIINEGGSDGDYDTRELETALRRVEAASVIFTTVPGPKMLWQFGELGYDFSINRCTNGSISNDCRLDPKPIKWDYLMNEYRAKLYNRMAAINHLKSYPTFSSLDYNFNDANFYLKTLQINHEDMDAVVLANYRVTATDFNVKFPYTGTWYEYFTGEELLVNDINMKLPFIPGEYRVYTSQKITPPGGFITQVEEASIVQSELFPNPISDQRELIVRFETTTPIEQAMIYSADGKYIEVSFDQLSDGVKLELPTLTSGIYQISLANQLEVVLGRFVKL